MPLGTPCDCTVVITDNPKEEKPFVVTAFPALSTALVNQSHYIT